MKSSKKMISDIRQDFFLGLEFTKFEMVNLDIFGRPTSAPGIQTALSHEVTMAAGKIPWEDSQHQTQIGSGLKSAYPKPHCYSLHHPYLKTL